MTHRNVIKQWKTKQTKIHVTSKFSSYLDCSSINSCPSYLAESVQTISNISFTIKHWFKCLKHFSVKDKTVHMSLIITQINPTSVYTTWAKTLQLIACLLCIISYLRNTTFSRVSGGTDTMTNCEFSHFQSVLSVHTSLKVQVCFSFQNPTVPFGPRLLVSFVSAWPNNRVCIVFVWFNSNLHSKPTHRQKSPWFVTCKQFHLFITVYYASGFCVHSKIIYAPKNKITPTQ